MRYIVVNLYIGKQIKKLNRYQRVRITGKVTYTQYAEIQSPCLINNIPLSIRRRTLNLKCFMTRYLALTFNNLHFSRVH